MAVAFDQFSRQGTGTGITGDASWTHTPVGTPRAVLMWALFGANTSPTVDHVVSMAYGALGLTQTAGSPNIKSTTESMQAHLFFAGASIPTGAQTCTIDIDTTPEAYSVGCITLTAGGDCEVVDSDGTINGDSLTDPSVTLALGGKTCFCAIGFTSGQNTVGGITPLTDWTARSEEDTGGQTMGVYSYNTIGSTDVTAGWTQAAEDAVAMAVAVSEIAAPGGGRIFKLAGEGGGLAGPARGLVAAPVLALFRAPVGFARRRGLYVPERLAA